MNIETLKATFSTVLEKKNVTLGGKKVGTMLALMGEKQTDGTIDKNVVSLYFSLENGLYYMIDTQNYSSEKKAINAALTLFIKNLKVKPNLQIINKTQYTSVAGSFNVSDDMNLLKSFNKMQFYFDINTPQQGSIRIEKSYDGE